MLAQTWHARRGTGRPGSARARPARPGLRRRGALLPVVLTLAFLLGRGTARRPRAGRAARQPPAGPAAPPRRPAARPRHPATSGAYHAHHARPRAPRRRAAPPPRQHARPAPHQRVRRRQLWCLTVAATPGMKPTQIAYSGDAPTWSPGSPWSSWTATGNQRHRHLRRRRLPPPNWPAPPSLVPTTVTLSAPVTEVRRDDRDQERLTSTYAYPGSWPGRVLRSSPALGRRPGSTRRRRRPIPPTSRPAADLIFSTHIRWLVGGWGLIFMPSDVPSYAYIRPATRNARRPQGTNTTPAYRSRRRPAAAARAHLVEPEPLADQRPDGAVRDHLVSCAWQSG